MLNRLKLRDARGDTIVEVLIVLAVLGLAIGVSYATANSSLQTTRAAQEDSQATELLQSQLEAMRSLASTDAANIFQSGSAFCINSAFTTVVDTSLVSPAPACVQDNLYTVNINYVNNAVTPDTFTLVATWPDIHGSVQDSETMVYRMHQ